MPEPIAADCLSGLPGIAHGFFTRRGGVSDGIYASLNCGHGSNDAADKVAENRRRIAVALGQREADQVLTLYQIHSATPVIVDRPLRRDALPKADALVTRTPGLVLGALSADCTPVLLASPSAGVVAAAHAGWRGAVTGILEATIEAMEVLGARREDIRAAVGPSISQAAYEVGPEFEDRFLAENSANAQFFRRPSAGGRPHFDLPGYNRARLEAAGIAAVELLAPCTFGNDSDFFSYRRSTKRNEPDYGRQISAIVVA